MYSLENPDNYIEQKSDDEILGEIENLAGEKIKFPELRHVHKVEVQYRQSRRLKENAITLHSIVLYTKDETGNERKHKQARSIDFESGGANIIRNILTNK